MKVWSRVTKCLGASNGIQYCGSFTPWSVGSPGATHLCIFTGQGRKKKCETRPSNTWINTQRDGALDCSRIILREKIVKEMNLLSMKWNPCKKAPNLKTHCLMIYMLVQILIWLIPMHSNYVSREKELIQRILKIRKFKANFPHHNLTRISSQIKTHLGLSVISILTLMKVIQKRLWRASLQINPKN